MGLIEIAKLRARLLAIVAGGLVALAALPASAERPRVYALTGATVVVAPGEVVEGATVVLRDGLIVAVGTGVEIPPDAEEIDAEGRFIYSGLIDAHSELGISSQGTGGGGAPGGGGSPGGGAPSTPPGAIHPLALIRAENQVRDALTSFSGDGLKTMEKVRNHGFTVTLAVPSRGIFAGESAAILLLDDQSVADMILSDGVAQHVAFQRASFGQGYPTSLMGTIAAFRQVLLDGQRFVTWSARYAVDPTGLSRPPFHATFDALQPLLAGEQQLFVTTANADDTLLADRLASEFELDVVISTSGAEWEMADAIAATGRTLIVSAGFPEKPKVKEDDEALGVSRRTLERYVEAAAAPAKLNDAGVTFALTMRGLKNSADFYKNVRKMIEAGLPEDVALAALTTVPAGLLGLERSIGRIEVGKVANVIIADGPLFEEDTRVREVYVDGTRHEIKVKDKPKGDPNAVVDPRGEWSVSFDFGGRTIERVWTITGDKDDYGGTAETRSGTVEFEEVELAGNALTVTLPGQGGRESTTITVIVEGDTFEGSAEFGPRSVTLTGSRTSGPDGDAR